MKVFLIALVAVAVLLITAVPGYLLIKKRMICDECIPGFSKVLVYVCQPCLAVYTFKSIAYSFDVLRNIGIFALLVTVINAVILLGVFAVLRKKSEKVIYRIMVIASCFANCGFFGIPVIEALLPDVASELIVYTTVWSTIMNVLAWTVGSAIISRDTKYISVKKIFLNPAMISAAAGFLIFVLSIPIQTDFYNMIVITGKMCTPLSMLIMGMRLAKMNFGSIFTNKRIYATVALKQLLMPLIGFVGVCFLPIEPDLKRVFFILCACPVASIVLNFAEIVGEGQNEAANSVLLSTLLSIITLPVMMLLLPLI